MSKLECAKHRFGFTGTLDGTQTQKWVLEGLFGPSYKVTKTDELIKQGHLSQLDIQCLVLKHQPQKLEVYNDEIEYLITHEQRNKFIKNLALDLKGNSLILYSRVEAHGAVLYDLINKDKKDNQKVFFVHGGVDAESREQIREITENEKLRKIDVLREGYLQVFLNDLRDVTRYDKSSNYITSSLSQADLDLVS